jgi:hypothetical protein
MDAAFWDGRRKAPSLAEQTEGLGLFDLPADTRLTQDDEHRLNAAAQRVLDFMRDGKPHTIREIRNVGGESGDRRLRELREAGYRFKIERTSEPGLYHYTLVT